LSLIAVVDNDVGILGMLTDLLENWGWAVATCADGEKAVAFLKDEQPDLVLLDLWLESPTSGWHVLRRLKLEPQTRDIPVVLLSEPGDPVQTKEEWLQEIGVAVLTKPFDVDLLYELVEESLNGSTATPVAS
jgi:CheY-like chemotaxis protein